MKKLVFLLPFVAGLVFFLGSCTKDNTAPADNNFTASLDDAYAENVFDNITNIADEAYALSSLNLKSSEAVENRIFLSKCATVSLDTTVFPRVLTIDFGDSNCLCNDGRYRRGKIIVSFTGRYMKPGTIRTTTFENFYVDDNQIEGSKVVTNNGFNDKGHLNWTITVNAVITLADGKGTISWKSQRNREFVAGFSTHKDRWDNVFLITGKSEGQRASGLKWSRLITKPLKVKLACRFIVSGTMKINVEGKPERILNFGDGKCDNLATVTVNGKTHTIHLRK
jgi:hypothetical protein